MVTSAYPFCAKNDGKCSFSAVSSTSDFALRGHGGSCVLKLNVTRSFGWDWARFTRTASSADQPSASILHEGAQGIRVNMMVQSAEDGVTVDSAVTSGVKSRGPFILLRKSNDTMLSVLSCKKSERSGIESTNLDEWDTTQMKGPKEQR